MFARYAPQDCAPGGSAEMPVVAFDMTSANQGSRRFEFRGKNNTEYYDGDLQPLSPLEVDMKIEKSVAGDYSIYKLVSHTGLAFRRSWAHIRNDKTDVTVFWFPRFGQIAVSHPGGRYAIQPHQCAITRSCKAFYMELTPDEKGRLEAMHVVVPSHKLYAIIGDSMEVGRPFPASIGDLSLAERILTMVFEGGDQIDPDMAEQLVHTLLNGLSRAVARTSDYSTQRCSITEKRISDIARYINQHFANPDLNAKMVADCCGISPRYLCHILKKNSLSFSNLLWERRMATAHEWLKDEKMKRHSISEIAYLVGFKSSAHFSRMFTTRFGVAPRTFRNLQASASIT
jgi:AraC family transcriptional regulator, positive regulator of tynA and feaB